MKTVTYNQLWFNGLSLNTTKKGNLIIIVFILELVLIAMEMLMYAIIGVITFYIGFSIAVYRDWLVYKKLKAKLI